MSNNVSEWRYRLKISQEAAAELLGISVSEVINLEANSASIPKSLKLAMLACELAYIAADQYVEKHPSSLNNIGSKNQVEVLGGKQIIDGFLNPKDKSLVEETIAIAEAFQKVWPFGTIPSVYYRDKNVGLANQWRNAFNPNSSLEAAFIFEDDNEVSNMVKM
jgi:transcriptional regulator with XRE-family HTH domain